MHIILGLIMVIAGTAIVVKAEWLLNNFGRIGFFDQHLGAEGGSRLGYKLIGILTIFIGILVMANLISGFLGWIFSPLLKYSRPQ